MSKRITVKINVAYIEQRINEKGWSNAYFGDVVMGKTRGWVSEWNRKDKEGNPTPKNLPSPEEAARMCAILQVRPEEILTEPGDIELVQGLIDSQKPEQKEKPTPVSESGQDRNIIKIAGRDGSFVERELTDDQLALMKNMLDQLKPIDDDRI